MRLQVTIALALLLLLQLHREVSAAGEGAWGYGASNGPSNWARIVPKWCSGRRQSPIKIKESEAVLDRSLVLHRIMQNPAITKFDVTNSGSSVNVHFRDSVNVSMGNGMGINSCYRPHSIHWHWGSAMNKGSEHWLEDREYPMEGHIVMWNCALYNNFSEAAVSFEGLAVLGVFYEEADSTDSAGIMAIHMAMIDSKNPQLRHCNASSCPAVEINAFPMRSLLPSNINEYFMYAGSLTTPDCRENVLWTVYKEPLKVPRAFTANFRMIKRRDGSYMRDNYRPPLPLNPTHPIGGQRVLARSFGSGDSTIPSSAEHLRPAAVLLLLMPALAVLLQ